MDKNSFIKKLSVDDWSRLQSCPDKRIKQNLARSFVKNYGLEVFCAHTKDKFWNEQKIKISYMEALMYYDSFINE